jgi:hypothetical protein
MWCLVNLAIVSLLGVLLRYKIAWSMPVVNYKYLLNAHSHFAFNGWVTTILFTCFMYVLAYSGRSLSKHYRAQFWLNQLSSYGMLVSFTWQGYGGWSIFFSTLSVLFSYWFAYRFARDMNRVGLSWPIKVCIRVALFFLVLSSIGPFLLAYNISHPTGDINFYFNAIYLYLHFQYNGWFTFGAMALLFFSVQRHRIILHESGSRWFVGLMAGTCVPAYTLSLLWTDPAVWVWWVASLAGAVQWVALVILTLLLWRSRRKFYQAPRAVKILWVMSYFAFATKIKLQALSVIPFFGHLAFGYRPVIITYLHLVMLCFVSFFIVGFLIREGILRVSISVSSIGLWVWVSGVIGNEVLLLSQSLLALTDHSWADSPFLLFAAALTILLGVGALMWGQVRHSSEVNQPERLSPDGS